jgi:hypothetical protein
MIARIHLVIDPRKLAVLIDQETHAARKSRLAIGTGAVRHSHAPVGIAKQRKRKVVFLGKVGILLDVIEADAEDLNVVLVEVANLIAEPATLDRSAGGIGLGIEPEDNFAPAQFRESGLLALMTREREVRRWFSNLEHYSVSSWAATKHYILQTPTEIRALNRVRQFLASTMCAAASCNLHTSPPLSATVNFQIQLSIARNWSIIWRHEASPGSIASAPSNSSIARNTIPLAA